MSLDTLLITDKASVRKAWNKTDQDVKEYVKIIKIWLETQKHLPEIPNDNVIEFFLTNCKYSVEKTKQNIDMYYSIRDLMPDLFRNIHPCKPDEIQSALNTGIVISLPKLTPDLYRVNVFQYKVFDPSVCDMAKFCAHYMCNVYEVRIQEDLVMGDIFIVDYEHMNFKVMTQITPVLLKNCAQVLEKVQSNRMKALHLINPPSYLDAALALFKSFFPKKLKDRFHTHKTVEDLYAYVPREILPSDLGGEEKSLKELEGLWMKKFEQYKERFDKLATMKIDESLRPEKLENDEILGYHGNFKKLNVD
ncbi:unnamed protein product [Phyllotreta striolata]|uniref:CRAL-TRIO domain-containing protein n=1 Tax=Phyllotreta striolata TaxID=444603 RepID=A0A9N9TKK2_PHYSR|nr:unnamed protein product [Phyllotreta striolata]